MLVATILSVPTVVVTLDSISFVFFGYGDETSK